MYIYLELSQEHFMAVEPCVAQTGHHNALYLTLLSFPSIITLKLFSHLHSCLKIYLDAGTEMLWHCGLGLWMEQ
jgi:hypothetical protein